MSGFEMHPVDVQDQFISEPLTPVPGAAYAAAMSRGEPGLPRMFTWRKQRHAVTAVLRSWKSSGREGGKATGEMYLRRHWHEIVTDTGLQMTVYCDRQARNRSRPKARWWVYTVRSAEA